MSISLIYYSRKWTFYTTTSCPDKTRWKIMYAPYVNKAKRATSTYWRGCPGTPVWKKASGVRSSSRQTALDRICFIEPIRPSITNERSISDPIIPGSSTPSVVLGKIRYIITMKIANIVTKSLTKMLFHDLPVYRMYSFTHRTKI